MTKKDQMADRSIGQLTLQLAECREAFQTREHEYENFVHNIQVNVQGILTDAELLTYNLERAAINVPVLRQDADTLLSKILLLLLTTNNIRPNLGTYTFAETDLDDLVSIGILAFSSYAADKGVRIVYNNLLGKAALAEVSRNHLRHAIHNLLHNAVKYSYERANRERTVDVTLRAHNLHFWMLKIVNYGVMIDPDEIPRVVENGYRSRNAEDRSRTGSGLGLFIVNSILKEHGGRLEISCKPVPGGAGVTTVSAYVPFRREERGEA